MQSHTEIPKIQSRNIGLCSLLFEELSPEETKDRLKFLCDKVLENAELDKKTKIELRIVETIAPISEFSILEEYLQLLKKYENASIRIAAGPIIEGNAQRKSPILEPAKKYSQDQYKVFIRPYQEEKRWKSLSIDDKPFLLQIKMPAPLDQTQCELTTFDYRGYCCSPALDKAEQTLEKRVSFPEMLQVLGSNWNEKFDGSLTTWEGRRFLGHDNNVACYTLEEIKRIKNDLGDYQIYANKQNSETDTRIIQDQYNKKENQSFLKTLAKLFEH